MLTISVFFPYILLSALLAKLANSAHNHSKKIFYIIFLFAICRYNIGYDYPGYWSLIKDCDIERFEPLSKLILLLSHLLDFPPLAFAIFSSISLFCINYVLDKHSSDKSLSLVFYFSFPLLFLQDLSTIRQAAAMGVIFLMGSLWIQGKRLYSLFCLFIATLLHNSAIVGCIFFVNPLLSRQSKYLHFIIFVLSFLPIQTLIFNLIVSLFPESTAVNRLISYVNLETASLNSFQYIFYAINLINLMFYDRLSRISYDNITYISIVNIGVILFNLFSFEPQTAIRICLLFFIWQVVLIPSYKILVSQFINKNNSIKYCEHLATNIIMLICFTLFFIYLYIYYKSYNAKIILLPTYFPYDFWWNNI